MKLVIDIDEDIIESAKTSPNYYPTYYFEEMWKAIVNGTVLPKGHGRLIDVNEIPIEDDYYVVEDAPTIIEAEKEYEAEVITRGNCMICGKELNEGLFFCKECEDKAESEDNESGIYSL